MALFLRGRVWWYEIKTPTQRIVKSTKFKKEDKAKATSVYQAALLGVKVRPAKSVVEGMLDAIYATHRDRLRISAMWPLYEDWFHGKAKQVAVKTWRMRGYRMQQFAEYAEQHRMTFAEDVTVEAARVYIASLGDIANKTKRIRAQELSSIWEACAEMVGALHNPWKAACPSDDGSATRRDIYTRDELARILEAAKKVGHHWYEVCMAAIWTGQRYGDYATMTWGRLEEAKTRPVLEYAVADIDERVIVLDPSKTRRHGTRIYLPIPDELAAALAPIRGEDGCFCFPAHASHYLQPTQMHPPFGKVLSMAKIGGGYHDFHSFRHTFRSMLGEAGVADATANRFGGWKAPRMGAHYDHAAHLDEMRAAIDAIKKTSAP